MRLMGGEVCGVPTTAHSSVKNLEHFLSQAAMQIIREIQWCCGSVCVVSHGLSDQRILKKTGPQGLGSKEKRYFVFITQHNKRQDYVDILKTMGNSSQER